MKVYLDNCAYNRPFDDQRDIIIHIETEAKLVIQQMIKDDELELIWSEILDYENNDNPFEERRLKIADWEAYASYKVDINDEIIEKARTYIGTGLRQKDAVHIASAVDAGGDYFITVDKKILNKSIRDITVIHPVEFLRRLQNDDRHGS
jgi:predicted nucleic acid-binding protein